jgi:hypothetical protein
MKFKRLNERDYMAEATKRNEQAIRIVQNEFQRVERWVEDQVRRTGRKWHDFIALGYGTRGIDLRIPVDPYKALTALSPLHQYVAQLAPHVDGVAVIETKGLWQVELTSIDREADNQYEVARADVPLTLALFDGLWSDGALPAVLDSEVADMNGLLHFSGHDGGMGL